jgi:hypothetical protein
MQRRFRSRSLRFLLVGLAATLSAIVLLGASGQAATEQQVRTYRHPTGLQVLVGEYREPGKVPDAFSATLGAAEQLPESAPGQFGEPWFDRTSKTAVLDVATARGAAMADAALRGDLRAAASLARPSAAESRSRTSRACRRPAPRGSCGGGRSNAAGRRCKPSRRNSPISPRCPPSAATTSGCRASTPRATASS